MPIAPIITITLTETHGHPSVGFAFPAASALSAIDNLPNITVPLPSSALMGMIIIGGFAAFARFPGHRRKHRT